MPGDDGTEAMVRRIVDHGSEVRVELERVDGTPVHAQLTRQQVAELELADGDIVYVRAPDSARPLASGAAGLGR